MEADCQLASTDYLIGRAVEPRFMENKTQVSYLDAWRFLPLWSLQPTSYQYTNRQCINSLTTALLIPTLYPHHSWPIRSSNRACILSILLCLTLFACITLTSLTPFLHSIHLFPYSRSRTCFLVSITYYPLHPPFDEKCVAILVLPLYLNPKPSLWFFLFDHLPDRLAWPLVFIQPDFFGACSLQFVCLYPATRGFRLFSLIVLFPS